jgi:hypothetical protein
VGDASCQLCCCCCCHKAAATAAAAVLLLSPGCAAVCTVLGCLEYPK